MALTTSCLLRAQVVAPFSDEENFDSRELADESLFVLLVDRPNKKNHAVTRRKMIKAQSFKDRRRRDAG